MPRPLPKRGDPIESMVKNHQGVAAAMANAVSISSAASPMRFSAPSSPFLTPRMAPDISRRWRPLWRSAPLNLQVDGYLISTGKDRRRLPEHRRRLTEDIRRMVVVSKILSDHLGPARSFTLRTVRSVHLHNHFARIDRWLRSRALCGLREIELGSDLYVPLPGQLPPSVFRFAPTLCVASINYCDFPNEMTPSLNFPCLKELTLCEVSMSEDTLHNMLSGCPVLESLLLLGNVGIGCLRISSPTLRSILFRVGCYLKREQNPTLLQELVIEYAPCLQRLLRFDFRDGPAIIRVMQAPKIEIMGMLSAGITVFQEMTALSLTTSMHTVKVLALDSLGPNLDSVVNFLECFPCVEKLHIMSKVRKNMKNARSYNPLDPIECLELRLKKVVINCYHGTRPDVDFAKFFVLNAKVLREMIFGAIDNCNDEWIANQHRRLQLDNKASPGAQFAFASHSDFSTIPSFSFSNADPFEWQGQEFLLKRARMLN